ncbi:MAG: glutathione peroxidase [Myxococcaceae bacterium]|nr:glutathione peroxidase [Myxococcaceae bacterium]
MRVLMMTALSSLFSFGCATGGRNPPSTAATLYEFQVNSLGGEAVPLSKYQGQVALVVNTASKCGKTPQYEGLQALYDEKKDQGFVVLGFPSNDFFGQEPGTAQEIRSFCTAKYRITFPLFEKMHVRGSEQSELYSFLSRGIGVPTWNFHKYLVGKDGKVIRAFSPGTQPDDRELVAAIDAALQKP